MRLFAAVVPPGEVIDELSAVVDPLRGRRREWGGGWDDLTWTLTDAWHLTLAFYGEVDDRKSAQLPARLERAGARYSPMTLRLGGAGRFGRSVLWIGVDGDVTHLGRLAASVAASGRRVGLEMDEGRRFRPHVTLARSSKRAVDLRAYVESLRGYAGSDWTVREFALVRSHLGAGPGGRAKYETIATYPLSRRGRGKV